MSTSFYVTRKLSQEEINKCKKLLDEQNFYELINSLPVEKEICHRAYGWQILWFTHNFKYFNRNAKSLFDFLKNSIITDEDGKQYSFEEFYKEIENSLYEGETFMSYYQDNPSIKFIHYYTDIEGVTVNEYGEFFIDRLRFVNNKD